MDEYTNADLMAAIPDVRDATAYGYATLDAKIDNKFDGLRHEMNRRFDRMDGRFDRLEGRVAAIEPHGQRPAS